MSPPPPLPQNSPLSYPCYGIRDTAINRNQEINIGKIRMGKTRDLSKKIRDTKGKFHAKMNIIKDRNGMNL